MTVAQFDPNMTLREAQDKLRELIDEGHKCPCCTQFAKVYRRKLNAGMARSLIRMYRAGGTEWLHLPSQLDARSREEGKLRYWRLVEEAAAVRLDGGRAGWWRVTGSGALFVLDRIAVQSHARIYDGRCLGLVGEAVTIRDCLGSRFDYTELMNT